jgi:hypothetical protein
MGTEVERIELYGGPHDGQRYTMQADSHEIHIPKPIEPQRYFTEEAKPLSVEPLRRDVYRFWGYNPNNGFKMFKWSYEI